MLRISLCTHVSLPYWLLLSRAAPFAGPVAPAQTLTSPLLSSGTRRKRARMRARARTHAHAYEPTFKCTQAESVLRRGTPGQYVIYRPDEAIEMPDDKFAPVCVSYLTTELEPAHNLVYFNVSATGGWAPFTGWVTIHPKPWTEGDPVSFLSGNMIFPNINALCEVLPELRQRIDPLSGEVMAMEASVRATGPPRFEADLGAQARAVQVRVAGGGGGGGGGGGDLAGAGRRSRSPVNMGNMKLADSKDAAAESCHTYTKLNWFNARWMSYVGQAKAQAEAKASIAKQELKHKAEEEEARAQEEEAYTCLGLVLVTTPAGA